MISFLIQITYPLRLYQVNEGHKFVTLVLGSLITLVLDDERPIVLERNVKFTSISSIESLDDEAVTLFKTTVLQNKGYAVKSSRKLLDSNHNYRKKDLTYTVVNAFEIKILINHNFPY